MMIMGVILALIVLFGFLVVMNDTRADQKAAEMKSYAFELQRELILASEVHEGYSRDIFIPDYIGQYDFEISNSDRVLVLSYEEADVAVPIPKITGTLEKGNNTIKNVGGQVVIE